MKSISTASSIEQMLTHEVEVWGKAGVPALLQRFVLAIGGKHKAAPLPDGVRQGPKKNCFTNAAKLVDQREGLLYVEGYGAVPEVDGMVFHHAWALAADGSVLDPTWDNPANCSYFGVAFTPIEACRERVRTRNHCLLDTGLGLNIELMLRRCPSLRSVVDEYEGRVRFKRG